MSSFRIYPIATTADIKNVYLQIRISEEHIETIYDFFGIAIFQKKLLVSTDLLELFLA